MSIGRSKDYKSLQGFSRTDDKANDEGLSIRPSSKSAQTPPTDSYNFINNALDAEKSTGAFHAAPSAPTDISSAASVIEADSESKQVKKDNELLGRDRWLVRNGHFVTFIGLYLFSIMVLFRPYEIVPGLGFLAFTAFYFAMATMLIYAPSQLAIENNLTMLSTEVKAILALTAITLITMPIARSPALAWESFNDTYIKAVIIFVVLINVVRTRKRLMAMLWLSFGIGGYLSVRALQLYQEGTFSVESYRVGISEIEGMFGNPNEMALHLVTMAPITLALALASKNKLMRVVYIVTTILFIAANTVTYSRGGFLGLLATVMVLAWKLGRKYRLNVTIATVLGGGLLMVAAPGNYGLRMLSIFIPGLDPVGSSDARREMLERSLIITARNPWGIGIGNFPIVGIHNHVSHNAFTQVSSELGLLGLAAYLVFMISPFRKLRAIERKCSDANEHNWFYYVSIGLQASIVGYWVSSFFASVAYNWFIYYLIAYAVAFRRIYNLETEAKESETMRASWGLQHAEAK
ncbi:MAG: O-antigen ligase family protein [Pyrinomonadaceae bacterium]